ncbi:MAG: FGGY-family carbohydrate kinase [Geminicoccaceae bacterium]
MRAVIVLDIGKTHVRLFAIEPDGGGVIEQRQTFNQSLATKPYLHVDVERIWTWMIGALADLGQKVEIDAIIPCAYGSTAALIDDDGLVLPMMDYEAEPPEDIVDAYAEIAPDFAEVCCPINPAGLTLARQLFWQSRHFPKAFERARWILPAAQYWAWRLTGRPAIEATSLGAQTQLWNPRTSTLTALARREGWADRFPERLTAYDQLAPLRPDLARRIGVKDRTPVLTGIHDSNANYARYLAAGLERFTLISSGTWLITFDTDLPLDRLDPARDMVSNTDLEGRPVACTRFMGGREFSEIAGPEGLAARPDLADVERIIEQGTMALPSFTDSGGPFPGTGNKGRIEGPAPTSPEEKSALATLYTALVTDTDLDLLASTGQIILDGSFTNNPLYAPLLAALRPSQTITVSRDSDGTALGAALLWRWQTRTEPVRFDLEQVQPVGLDRLADYWTKWRSRVR